MRPKGKLLALLAIFAAIGLVTATGAFTTVSAERTVNVNVAGDSAALLQIEANATSPNGAYAATNGNQFQIDLSSNNADFGGAFTGSGVNDEALTRIDHVFNVTNQGTQAVEVTVTGLPNGLIFYLGGDHTAPLTSASSATRTINPGETLSIGVQVDTRDAQGNFQAGSTTVSIEANAV